MAVLNPTFRPLLSRSHPIKVGTISTANQTIQWAMPSGDSYSYRGQLIIQVISVGGTLTSFIGNVQASLDGGTTFANVPPGTASADFATAATNIQRFDMSGLGAIQCQFTATTVTLGTATSGDVWLTCG